MQQLRMGKKPTRTKSKARAWPRKITLGRESVTIYRRATSAGSTGYMVANYAGDKRRFDSYTTEAEALVAAGRLVRQLSERQVVAASLTNEQAAEYAAAVQTLAPFNLPLSTTASTVTACLKLVGGDLPSLHAAAASAVGLPSLPEFLNEMKTSYFMAVDFRLHRD